MNCLTLREFAAEDSDELLPMWRDSFEAGVGIMDPHPLAEQANYFWSEVVPKNLIQVARCAGRLVGFVAASSESVAQLYVRVGCHRRGIGTALLDWAKSESLGHLSLFTFAKNSTARAFYESHGFRATAHGFEPHWQLADVRYEWSRDAGLAIGRKMSTGYVELLDAITFAAAKHRNQRRKDAEANPYINHPLQLAHVLADAGDVTDLKTLMAAVLHDTVEDTDTSYEELCERFGKVVADVVMEVTEDKSLPKAERKQHQVDHAPHMSTRAALVELADKTCNLRDVATCPPSGWSLKRKREYFDWAKQVVDGLPPVNKELKQVFSSAFALRP